MSRIIWAGVRTVTVLLLALAGTPGEAGGEKTPVWKPFLPPDTYQELTRRSIERLHVLAKDADAMAGLRAEAVILAGYTISTKDAPALAGLRSRAIKIATAAADKGTAEQAHKLAAALSGKGDKGDKAAIDWPAVIGDISDLMTPLANKAKGGDGIPVELQYTAKLKSQNGGEALLVALSTKQLSVANSGKLAKEIELLCYRVATIGALTRRRGPTKHKEETKLWDEQATIMRDAAVEIAEAARQKDATTILAASKRLVSACAECHANFKK